MDIHCQRRAFLPSGDYICESFVVRHPGAGCTLRSRAQRRLLPARVQAAAPGGGDSNGEKRRRKPWRKKSKDSAAGKEKVLPLPEKLGVEDPLRELQRNKQKFLRRLMNCGGPAESCGSVHSGATTEAEGGREREERGAPQRRAGSRWRRWGRWLIR